LTTIIAGTVVALRSMILISELVRGSQVQQTITAAAYCVGIAVVLPAALFWALAERTRWSSAVLVLAGVTVAVMTARISLLWRTGTV
jgi:hypothetical protein